MEENTDIIAKVNQRKNMLFQDVCSINSKRNLDYYKKFYQLFPDIQIVNARVHNLEWTHVRRILSVANPDARLWYLTMEEWKEYKFISRIGSDKTGHWEVIRKGGEI